MINFKDTLKQLRILYIEDEDGVREYFTKTLNLLSKEVISVSNVEDAKDIYSSQNVDIIISDINLKGVSGIEFVKELRQTDTITPVILLTAHSEKSFLFEAIKLNLIDYLVKPVDFNLLNETLKKAVKSLVQNGKLEITFISGIKYNLKQNLLYDEDNKEIKLTSSEKKLLKLLLQNKERTISSEEIKYHIWEDNFATDGALKSLINKLRSKIGKESIKNHSSIGYQLILRD